MNNKFVKWFIEGYLSPSPGEKKGRTALYALLASFKKKKKHFYLENNIPVTWKFDPQILERE